jgi:hypothetical protein
VFIVQPLLLRHRTGRSAWLPSLGANRAERTANVLFLTACGLELANPALALAGIRPLGTVPVPAVVALSVVLFLGGLVLAVLAQNTMGRAWRTGIDPGFTAPLVVRRRCGAGLPARATDPDPARRGAAPGAAAQPGLPRLRGPGRPVSATGRPVSRDQLRQITSATVQPAEPSAAGLPPPLSPRVPEIGALELLLSVARLGSLARAGRRVDLTRTLRAVWPAGRALTGILRDVVAVATRRLDHQ